MEWPPPLNAMPAFHGTHGEVIRCFLPVGHFYALDQHGDAKCVSKEIIRKNDATRSQPAPRRGQTDVYVCRHGIDDYHDEHVRARPKDFAYCVIRDYARCISAEFSDVGRGKEAVQRAVNDLYGGAPCPFSVDDLYKSMKGPLKVCAETGFDYPGGLAIGVGHDVRVALERGGDPLQPAPEPQAAQQGDPRGYPPGLVARLAEIDEMWRQTEEAYPEFFVNGRLAQ